MLPPLRIPRLGIIVVVCQEPQGMSFITGIATSQGEHGTAALTAGVAVTELAKSDSPPKAFSRNSVRLFLRACASRI